MQSCAPAVCKPGCSDRSAYGAVIADACEFNRGLSRDRASRLPFLDLATQTAQKPAPWLYRNRPDITKDFLGLESHIYARYTRHRWNLSPIAPAKRRKLAADRLWYNLQNGLGALGVPAELIPSVTQRAFTLANLPIPASLASHLDSSLTARTSVTNLSAPSSFTMSTPNGSRSHPMCLTGGPIARRSLDSSLEPGPRKLNADPLDATEDIATRVNKPQLADALGQSTRLEEGTTQSTEASGPNGDLAEDMNFVDHPKLEDDANKLGNEAGQIKSYEMDEDSDEADDALVDGVEDEDDDDEEEELDDEDDVEWVQPRGKRAYSASGHSNKTFPSRKQQRKRVMQSRKGSMFSSPTSRLSERRMIRGRAFATGSQDKVRLNLRSSDSTELSMIDSLGPRRSGRAHATAKTKSASSVRTSKDKDSSLEDRWPSYSEPGFQPNSSFLPTVDRTYAADSGDLADSLISHSYPSETPMISTNKDASIPVRDPAKSSSIQPLSDSPDFPPQSTSQIAHPNSTFNRLLPDVATQMAPMPPTSYAYPGASRTTMAQLLASASSSLPSQDMTTTSSSLEYVPSSTIHPGRSYCATGDTVDCNPTMFSPRTPTLSQSSVRHQIAVPRDPSEHHTGGGSTTTRSTQDFAAVSRFAVNRETSTPVTVNLESFATPQVATTTVTFFVCEVCASRYRSTAGLRYHYHSQHSGYTPKNPISASASRLVVPVGEERGIGGGLRGGRPRRHKDAHGRGPPAASLGDNASASFASSYTTGSRSVIPTRPGARIPSTTEYFGPSASTIIDSAEVKSNDSEHAASMTPTSRTADGFTELQRVQTTQRSMPSYTLDNASASMGFGHSHHSTLRSTQTNWSSADTYHLSQSSQQQQQPTVYHTPPFRLTPHQRRLERQRCPDRVNLIGQLRPAMHHGTPSSSCCCVYCLGDERMNPRLGRPEGLLRCARCGSLAHFACLHLPTHVIDNAMRYPWQCIECKTCWLCGSHEQENRMIFCGDCDRVFHVDCLPIPVSRLPPPTAHWSCDICLHDLYAITDAGPNNNAACSGPDRGADRVQTGSTTLESTEAALYSGSC